MKPANDNKWSHDGLQHDLAEYLRTTRELIAWENMQLGPAGSSRPDVYALPRSFAHFRPLSYECKVSIADFRSDVTSGKWQEYLRFSCGVIFAVPAGLIDKKELPTGCGLIVRSADGWRTIKGPTLSPLPNLPLEVWIKLLIDGVEREAARQRRVSRAGARSYELERKLLARHGKDIAELVSTALQSREKIQYEITKSEAQLKAVRDTADKAHKEARERIERENAKIRYAVTELTAALGLPADADQWAIIAALRRAVERANADAEVKRLHRLVGSARKALDEASEQILAPCATTKQEQESKQ